MRDRMSASRKTRNMSLHSIKKKKNNKLGDKFKLFSTWAHMRMKWIASLCLWKD